MLRVESWCWSCETNTSLSSNKLFENVARLLQWQILLAINLDLDCRKQMLRVETWRGPCEVPFQWSTNQLCALKRGTDRATQVIESIKALRMRCKAHFRFATKLCDTWERSAVQLQQSERNSAHPCKAQIQFCAEQFGFARYKLSLSVSQAFGPHFIEKSIWPAVNVATRSTKSQEHNRFPGFEPAANHATRVLNCTRIIAPGANGADMRNITDWMSSITVVCGHMAQGHAQHEFNCLHDCVGLEMASTFGQLLNWHRKKARLCARSGSSTTFTPWCGSDIFIRWNSHTRSNDTNLLQTLRCVFL